MVRSEIAGEPRVDFMVIGAQKAGTTALFDYLSDDPAFSLSAVKEVHFFDDEGVDWDRPDYRPYHAQFDFSGPGLRGEATPIYVYWPGSLERIYAYNPQTRLILILRDPVERAWSHWRMETVRGVETHPFSWCIRQGRQRLMDAMPRGFHREYSYVERGFYGAQIERVLALFPRDQLLVLTAERLRSDPHATLAAVNRFLGVPQARRVTAREVHVGQEMNGLTIEDTAYLREVYAPDAARLRALTGISFPLAPSFRSWGG